MGNMDIWNNLKQPPKDALRTISGGRMNGKTDISPAWRMEAMTEQFGPCGTGWDYSIDKLWTEPGTDGQVFSFALVSVVYKIGDEWSRPVPGIGGNMLIEKERSGLHDNDEGFKMAVTDALSVALKAIGVAADIYRGRWDGSKYGDGASGEPTESKKPDPKTTHDAANAMRAAIDEGKRRKAAELVQAQGIDEKTKGEIWNACGRDIDRFIARLEEEQAKLDAAFSKASDKLDFVDDIPK